jgi:hypothetical protein
MNNIIRMTSSALAIDQNKKEVPFKHTQLTSFNNFLFVKDELRLFLFVVDMFEWKMSEM